MRKKRTILNLGVTAAIAALSISTSFAQLSLGTSCGCPALGSRTIVDLATLADANGNLTAANTVLSCNNLYKLTKKIYVGDGKTITIEPGTVIKGQFAVPATNATALIVSRGGKIIAPGTESCPVIFTAEADNVNGAFPVGTRGQWGGVIILGKAKNNLKAGNTLAISDGVGFIEGTNSADSRNHYGGTDDNDNSGVLKYVSIRHGGAIVGADNEINGLTLGSVGRATELDHIEVVANDDDGIEFFGGTVDLKYATVLFCNDDSFDWDQGWTGRGQFWFAAKLNGVTKAGDHGFEGDGDDNAPNLSTPLSHPKIYNATFIGNANAGDRGVEAKEATEGEMYNSIITNYVTGVNLANTRAVDAEENFTSGSLLFANNSFDGVPALIQVAGAAPSAAISTQFTSAGNVTEAGVIDFTFDINPSTNAVANSYNPVPAAGKAATNLKAPTDGFFDAVQYKGAFEPGKAPWTAGWSISSRIEVDNSVTLVSCTTDLNKDGITNNVDFLTLVGKFGQSCGH